MSRKEAKMHDEETMLAIRSVGILLELLRRLNALSLAEASECLGMEEYKLLALEAGKFELNDQLLRPIADLYRVNVDFLFLPFDKTDELEAFLNRIDFSGTK